MNALKCQFSCLCDTTGLQKCMNVKNGGSCCSAPKAVGCSSAPEVKIRLVDRCVLPILSHTECCPAPALLCNGGKLLPKASLLPCATLINGRMMMLCTIGGI